MLEQTHAELRTGLDRATLLPIGTGFAQLSAGMVKPWGGTLDAFVRAELGARPLANLSAFAFAEANRFGAQAGVGARVTF